MIGAGLILIAGYLFYGRWLAKKWGVDPNRKTPAHTERDDIDFVPAKPVVLFGHHFSSIAGSGPIQGPILAAAFGWIPVTIWILVAGIFIGAPHDFGATLSSVRNKGAYFVSTASKTMGRRTKILLSLIALFALILLMGSFLSVTAETFSSTAGLAGETNCEAASISILLILIAFLVGYVFKKYKPGQIASLLIGLIAITFAVVVGSYLPISLNNTAWLIIISIYIILASALPVWILLQPRDFLCSFLLYGMLLLSIVGIIFAHPDFEMEGFVGFEVDGSLLFPMLFVTVACGAVSGYHGLVSTGTTSKQIDNEKDILPISFGGMLLESFVAIVAVICVAISVASDGDYTPTQIMARAIGGMFKTIGLGDQYALIYSLIILAVSAFCLTTLDTAARLARFIVKENTTNYVPKSKAGETAKKLLSFNAVAASVPVLIAFVLALIGYSALWTLFGSCNALMAAMILLVLCSWLNDIGKDYRMLVIPSILMSLVAVSSLVFTIVRNILDLPNGADINNITPIVVSVLVLICAIVLIKESIICLKNKKAGICDEKRID